MVGALAAVLGSLAGGSATVAAGWVTQRTQGRRELIQADIRKRGQVCAASSASARGFSSTGWYHTFEEPQKLAKAYELLNCIRLLASDAVLAEAERVVRRMTEQYFEPNLSREQIRALLKAEGGDPMRPFGEACRAELKAMRAGF